MISVVTVTQLCRHRLLKLLADCILAQTILPNEWVIVEGSKTSEDAIQNSKYIKEFNTTIPFPVVYIPFEENMMLGGLRNKGNKKCTGDYIVCMDDDDYYPARRIEQVKYVFDTYPQVNLTGCSGLFIHDYEDNKFYHCRTLHENHSITSAMAWRKTYLENHQHDETAKFAEDRSFTNGFSEPMVQLDPVQTIILSCHNSNLYVKRTLLANNPQYIPLKDDILPFIMDEDMYELYKSEIKRLNEEVPISIQNLK
jgi:glycosyltransferase involved in cell wall biosynthesis